jgi:hypothetical protein
LIFLDLLRSKLFGKPLDIPLSPKHKHSLVVRNEMDKHPIEDPDNWLPKKSVDIPIYRPHLWRKE